jgi:hypothetical protein
MSNVYIDAYSQLDASSQNMFLGEIDKSTYNSKTSLLQRYVWKDSEYDIEKAIKFLNKGKIYRARDLHPDLINSRSNNYGFVCDDFKENLNSYMHILFAGCSITVPYELHEDFGWAKKVYNNIHGYDGYFFNMAYPGGSLKKIVFNLFRYFQKYGNPEYLFILAPEIQRDISLNNSSTKIIDIGKDYPSDHEPPNVIKSLIEYVSLVKILEQYCNKVGIKMLWTCHDLDSLQFLSTQNFNNYFQIDSNYLNLHIYNYKKEWLGKYPDFHKLYLFAGDGSHPGAGTHNYIANAFLEELKKRNMI